MLRPSQLYLLAYNSANFLGWTFAVSRVLGSLIATKSLNRTYEFAGGIICLLQAASFLEVIHATVGLVPSGVVLVLMQWGGRTHFLFAIVRQIAEVQVLPSVFISFLAWSISETVRYPHYSLTLIKLCPNWLTYLRYTAFIILYPIGVGPGEMWIMYKALPFIQKRRLYSGFFGQVLPFSYHSFVLVVLLIYPFLWFKLYLHLLKQRRSKVAKVVQKSKKKDKL